jgi:predicted site-specific integrase-resolvase
MNNTVLTAALAAERLGVSTRTIHRWAADGFFPGAYKLNPAIKNSPLVIPAVDVEVFEQKRKDSVATAKAEGTPSQ